jgi:uncharacterized membrane protein YvlD (DUF360 family)
MEGRWNARFVQAFLCAGALFLYLATIDHQFVSPDERARYALAELISREGITALANSGSVCRYPPLTSIWASPFIHVGARFDAPGHDEWAHRAGAFANTLIAVIGVFLFSLIMRLRKIQTPVWCAATVAYILTNPIWPYTKRFYSEPMSTTLALACLLGVVIARRRPILGVSTIALSVLGLGLNVPAAAAVVAIAAVMSLGSVRRYRLAAALAGAFVLCGGIVLITMRIRFGGPSSGYDDERFTFNMIDGLYGLLLSPGRSVFLFAPLVLLSVLVAYRVYKKGERDVAVLCMSALLGQIVLIGAWWAWFGGQCWGPRLILPVLPLATACVPAWFTLPRWRWLAIPVVAWGLWVQGLGLALVHEYDQYLWPGKPESWSWFRLDYSQLTRVPRDIAVSPWDMSSDFLRRENRTETVIHGDGQPVRYMRVQQQGQSILHYWAISDVVVALDDGTVLRGPALNGSVRVRDGYGMPMDGRAAMDASHYSAWTSAPRYRKPGMAVQLDLGAVRNVRSVALVHGQRVDDFPSDVTATAQIAPDSRARPLRVAEGTPKIWFDPMFFKLLAAGAISLILAGIGASLRGRKR